jgi:hypothetical protein
MIARVGMVFYWCGLAIASLCEIAAFAISVMFVTDKLAASEAWMSAVFFAVLASFHGSLVERPSTFSPGFEGAIRSAVVPANAGTHTPCRLF